MNSRRSVESSNGQAVIGHSGARESDSPEARVSMRSGGPILIGYCKVPEGSAGGDVEETVAAFRDKTAGGLER